MYIDSDDWLGRSDALTLMYKKAEETGSDYVEINFYRVIDRFGIIKQKMNIKKIIGLIERPELFEKYFISYFGTRNLSVSMCGKLYRKAFLERLDLTPMDIKMGEDLAYNIRLFPYLKKIYILKENGYYYRYGGVTSKYNPNLFPDSKKIQALRDKMIRDYNYKKADFTNYREVLTTLMAEVRQRIRYRHGKENIINFLNQEISDPIYLPPTELLSRFNSSEYVFVENLIKGDSEKIYAICYDKEKKMRWRFKFVNLTSKILKKL